MRLHPTKNYLPESVRPKAMALLGSTLADCIDLQTQNQQAYRNVKGADFIAVHKLIDEINEDVEDYVDLIAERAVQLGATVKGMARAVAAKSSLPEYPLSITNGRDHVAALANALVTFGKSTRQAIS